MAAASQDTHDDKAWSMQWTYIQNRDQSVTGESYQPTQANFALQRRFGENTRAGVGHDYRVLDLPRVEGVPADTNGHVHQLGVGWRAATNQRRYELTAALAVSSNALKHPSDLEAEDVRLAGAIEQRLGESWRVAVRADDRFGRFRLYPAFELFLQPTPVHEVRVGFPESSWRWQWARPLQSEIAVAPDGGRWRVRDPTLERHSIVRLSSWRATLSLHWQPFDLLGVKAQVGRVFETALRYQLRDSSQTRVDPSDATFFSIVVSARI
ncbi:MAG TPA: hypothetical protein VNA44_10450 [Burkholderiaceae bacterium]|nr:hypothetical protein [Burkholderiaceae bacterium]